MFLLTKQFNLKNGFNLRYFKKCLCRIRGEAMSEDDFSINTFGDFIDSEAIDVETFNLIYNFVALDNFREGEYEGNMYVIRKVNVNHIQLENEVATENNPKPIVYVYTKGEFLWLFKSLKPEF